MKEDIPLISNKVFSRMYVNPKLQEILRTSKLNNVPLSVIDFKYDHSKGH